MIRRSGRSAAACAVSSVGDPRRQAGRLIAMMRLQVRQLPWGLLSAEHADQAAFHGSITSIPHAMKSRELRVASEPPRDPTIAAICASA